MNQNVSAYCIIGNSEDCAGRTLKWLNDHFEDIVVVKCDSTDNTDDVIDKNIGHARLYYRKMPPSFGEQWEYARQLCVKDWRIPIGADEIIALDNFDEIVDAIHNYYDLAGFWRYNLQKDINHYKLEGFPDPQPRLAHKSCVISQDIAHEHLIYRNGILVKKFIIHYGHIREDKYLVDKARIRRQMGDVYFNGDTSDGAQISKNENWYVDRNKEYEKSIAELPQDIKDYIKKYER
jgi:glycosyltransferase involved in cell wall biosynthesis